MKATFVLLMIVSAFAINIDLAKSESSLHQSVSSTKWGQLILAMADLSTETNGPLQELVQSIQDLLQEVESNISEVEAKFQSSTDSYNRDKTRLESEVNDGQIEISNTSDIVDNVLLPLREQTNSRLAQVQKFLEDNRKRVNQETLARSKANQDYQERARSHQLAANAVDECINLLQGISNTGSLAQVKRLQNSFDVIQAQISKSEIMGPFATMIMQITSEQNFSDQSVVQKLKQMFNDLRKDIVDEINQENSSEQEAQGQFKSRQDALNGEYIEFVKQITEATYQLSAIETKLQSLTELLVTRKSDLASFTAQLEELNNWYAGETQVYNDLRQKYLAEGEAAQKAYELVTNPDFLTMAKQQVGL